MININESRNYPEIQKYLPEELEAKTVKSSCLWEAALGMGKDAAGTIIFYYTSVLLLLKFLCVTIY